MTLKQFELLYNEHRASQGKHAITFSLTKSKVITPAVNTYDTRDNGVPYLKERIPPVTKLVVDTNGLTKLYQAMWLYYLGTKLKRISSEGSWRPNVGFIPNTNKGIADLMGGYEGKVYYIEVKQSKERLLPSQIKFKEWVESFGGEYHIIHSFEEMWELICNIKKT